MRGICEERSLNLVLALTFKSIRATCKDSSEGVTHHLNYIRKLNTSNYPAEKMFKYKEILEIL
jgi:hypothetical protein